MTDKPTYEELQQKVKELENIILERAQSEKEIERIFKFSPDMIGSGSLDGYFTKINSCFESILGYAKKEFLKKQFISFVHEDDVEKTKQALANAVNGKQKIEIENRYMCKDGSYKWIDWKVLSIVQENKFIAVGRDITERKQAEKAFQESEEQYKNLYDNALVGMWRSRISDGKLLKTNNVHARMSGFSSPEEAVNSGFKLSSLYPAEKRKELIELLKQNGSVSNFEAHLAYPDGREQDISIAAKMYPDKGYMEGVVIDISSHKRAEKEKIKAQKIAGEHEKLALVGQIAGKMAHDFNNVLGIIMGNAELFLLDCKDAQTKKTLELIYEQTIRGKNLTKNLVAFAKDQEPKQEFFRINEKIDLVINLLRKDLEGIELIKEEKTGVPELLADPGMIEHAIVNLLQNSVHATSLVKNPRVILRSYCDKKNIYFEIEDNGCGIPADNLKNIFEPSFTLKGNRDITGSYESRIKGTGYGMANVKKIY